MADAAVEFLLNNLKDLLLYHSHLITDTKKQIETLEMDLRLFNAFLKDSLRKRRKDERTKVLVRNIRDVVYEVEDVIDAFITQAMEKKATSSFFKFWKPSVNLHEIGVKVEEVRTKVEKARIDFADLSVHDEDNYGKPEARPPRQKDVVGFADVTEELISRLTQETDYFDVVSLIGMFGLGKTTLAWKIFNDPAIIYKFPVRIWLPISQEFSDKDIFLAILKEFTTVNDDLRQKADMEIARIVAGYLDTASFFIVLDDVWNRADWDRLRVAMPENNHKGKILITSRIEDVGTYASCPRPAKKLRFFNQDESWELLQLEALRKLDCPSELQHIGQLIARDCDGLPLAIVVIGGILAAKFSASDLSETRKAWENVSTRVSTYLNEKDPADRMKKFISLSYDRLPYHLRACFLYLGVFPEDYKIPVSRLIRMWIGEGFIQQNNDLSLEECGEMYLEDLINRNLVTIEKIKPNGKVKTCCIHDALRDFCRNEAGNENENFLQEIKSNNGGFAPPVSDLHKYRRLSIHFNCLKFISQKPLGHRVRTFVCFSKDEFTLPAEDIPHLLSAFKLLRVLEVKPMRLTKISSQMYQLIHARYISMSLDLSTLPSKFGLLWNTQTLIVDTTSRTLEVKADIWKLSQLRHFKTNASAHLPKPSKDSKHGAELQTLSTISAESCTAELFERACNLKKLGIRGRLALLLEGKIGSFDSLGKMKCLEKLKLVNDVHPKPISEGQLRGLPQPYQFPSKLKSLTLVATSLSWSFMSNLGLLENLEVLKLKDKAFVGTSWKAADGGFRRLEFLQIEETDLTFWEASHHHFPRLRGLVLKNCEKLLVIPIGLAEVESLHRLELYVCKSAAQSAKKIYEAKMKKKKTQAEGSVFKYSIFPPID
ncbi:putative late blight resistance protein homolog R1A-10 [Salvia miltiorrhiza]|uniref:putative late blight resistance protein homolog R1A-10 n=1 Tax=Salvia miltiorrhiza TaxID=226208 RepID=UPI0025AC126B|nr:putative late blight resistance protein homolog R1A-10 [Salvia miltiorrhiza]